MIEQFKKYGLKLTQIFVITAFFLILGACATGRGINKGQFNMYTYEEEKQIGRKLANMVSGQVKFILDPEINSYMDKLGQKLVNVAHDTLFDYQFRVIKDRQVNAFTISAGYVYMYAGLIKEAPYEAAFASVVGHEIGHNLARHVTERLSKQNLLGIASAVVGGPIGSGINLFGSIGLLQFGKREELEADRLGVALLNKAGYNPNGAKAIFEIFKKLQAKQSSAPLLGDLLSTHPDPQDRINQINKIIPKLKRAPTSITNTRAYKTFKANVLKFIPKTIKTTKRDDTNSS